MLNEPLNRYRPNVAAIIQHEDGRILIAERMSPPGAWQFPQGGIDAGESPHDALTREVEEELSLSPQYYKILSVKGPYRYLFEGGRTKRGFRGQEQLYFLLRLTGLEQHINVATQHQEFRCYRWIAPHQFDMRWVPGFKQEVYRAVLRDFFGVEK